MSELVAALARLEEINRSVCRERAEQRFSLEAQGERLENWFDLLIN